MDVADGPLGASHAVVAGFSLAAKERQCLKDPRARSALPTLLAADRGIGDADMSRILTFTLSALMLSAPALAQTQRHQLLSVAFEHQPHQKIGMQAQFGVGAH